MTTSSPQNPLRRPPARSADRRRLEVYRRAVRAASTPEERAAVSARYNRVFNPESVASSDAGLRFAADVTLAS